MKTIHDVIRSAAPASDTETMGLIRAGALECAPSERPDWFRQLDLSLDGYGGMMSQRAEHVRALLKQVQAEMSAEG